MQTLKDMLKDTPELKERIEKANPVMSNSVEKRVLTMIQETVKNLKLDKENNNETN